MTGIWFEAWLQLGKADVLFSLHAGMQVENAESASPGLYREILATECILEMTRKKSTGSFSSWNKGVHDQPIISQVYDSSYEIR